MKLKIGGKIMCGIMYYSGKDVELLGFESSFDKIVYRGPDSTEVLKDKGVWGFHRLSIMDLSNSGMQPFMLDGSISICNGEIYNFRKIKKELESKYKFHSGSDCEILIPLYKEMGVEMFKQLDAEYAMVMYDAEADEVIASRDPIGIRPLFYGYSKTTKEIAFCSEAKGLIGFCDDVMAFPPGHYYKGGEFVCYRDMTKYTEFIDGDIDEITAGIKERLEKGVIKRLDSDAPVGYLLSGGLDSSLVCAIAQKNLDKPLKTFAIGMDKDPIDLKYAKVVADYLGTDHTEVTITEEDVLKNLRQVIYTLETWDITTIRASMGMYLVCKYIRENTDLKVVLTGEISDEIFGYKYTDFAPSPEEFQKEAEKRLQEIYMYDVLRADRSISAHSLEARVPFGDLDFVDYVMGINPAKKMNTYNKGKYLLRKAFEGGDYLPYDILHREKAAFSDAVGHSLVDCIKAFAEEKYTEQDVEDAKTKYTYGTPFTKESLLYRDIFEEFFPGMAYLIKDFWMPNKEWEGCNVNDPSARVLSNYGDSGK
jgi:asparagine synthase (glutamine-hydrolysing)